MSMSGTQAGPLVSCEWLKENLGNVNVLDASWYLPSMERSPGVKFDGEHFLQSGSSVDRKTMTCEHRCIIGTM